MKITVKSIIFVAAAIFCLSLPAPAQTRPQNDAFGILFESNVVSDTAKIIFKTPERAAETKFTVYDMAGNMVFNNPAPLKRPCSDGNFVTVWNLQNSAGRRVANGTYLIIAQVKGESGKLYRYSAELGVKR